MINIESIKNAFLKPFFAIGFSTFVLLMYVIISYIFAIKYGYFDIEEIGVTEVLTYLFYGVGFGIAVCCIEDYVGTDKQGTYFAIMFLWFAALLREMGIQHWLTTHDTVITKLRFFTNPANPMYEKIIAALLMGAVVFVALYLLIKYFKCIVKGILKLDPKNITILAFGILVLFTQIADRLPANYMKSVGTSLSEPILFILKIFEEGGESILPLLFAIVFLQYHIAKNK